jgi:PAS domain S-box-containing protein
MKQELSSLLFDSSVLGGREDPLEFLANVLQSSVEYSIICKALDGTIVLWNEGARRLYGYEPEEVVGKANSSILHTPEDVKAGKPREMREAAIRDGKWEGTVTRMRKNGERFTARMALTPRRDDAGHVIGFLLISKDISAEIRAQGELHESERRYRSLFENMINGYAYCEMLFENGQPQDFIFHDVNPYFEELSGLTNVSGKKVSELVPGIRESSPDMLAVYGRVARTGRPERFETYVAGLERWFSIAVYSPEAGYFVAVFDNITERKATNRAERASELRYRRLFESAKDGILILDAETGQIVDANPFLLSMLGYSSEELIGKELWQIGVFKDIAAARDSFEELRDKGYVRYDDLPLETRGGVTIDVEFVSNVYAVGDAKVIQCNIRDITERLLGKRALEESNRKLETTLSELSATTQQLWQASKLATMGELSASVAHELNNPLATVALRVENMLMTMTADEGQRHSLEVISQEVDRMANLVDNLLHFSRRSHRQISTVDVREEIAKSVDFVHYHLRSRKIEVVRDFADPLPTIQADCQQLRQLFLNLLTNASDAMPQGGTVTVRAQTGVLHEFVAVKIDFADTGEGIPPENLKKIWDSFFTTKTEGKGTGLGLAICRRIVEEHGGSIDIESEVGRGTTVRMLFPATANGVAANLL